MFIIVFIEYSYSMVPILNCMLVTCFFISVLVLLEPLVLIGLPCFFLPWHALIFFF